MTLLAMTDTKQLVALANQHLYPNYRQPPLVMARGKGATLWDTEGRRYIDLYAGIAVSAVGHAHPRLVEAIANQAATLMHQANYYLSEPNILLADELCRRTQMDRAFFCNSGTEANEAMLKLARRHFFNRGDEKRFEVIAFDNSFHGRTLGSLAATGQKRYSDGFGPLAGVVHVPFGDLEAVKRVMTPRVAAVLVEPVQGEGGVISAPSGFFRGIRELCDESGALLLVDEVQTGMGRTGRFLGIEHFDVRPDALSMAKALGGGFPIGAMLCAEFLHEALPPGSHGSTYGGNPLASAAALATLRILDDEGLVERASTLGQELASRLERLVEHDARVTQRRGMGLMQAVALDPAVEVAPLVTRLRDAGVLVTAAGGNSVRLTPPLNIHEEELEEGLQLMEQVIGAYR